MNLMDEKFVVVDDHSKIHLKQFLMTIDVEVYVQSVDFGEMISLDEDQYFLEQIMVAERQIVVLLVFLLKLFH
jgi:hypothetical protein